MFSKRGLSEKDKSTLRAITDRASELEAAEGHVHSWPGCDGRMTCSGTPFSVFISRAERELGLPGVYARLTGRG